MIIFPAIDLIEGSAVRLSMGDYNKKTVYSSSPLDVAVSFKNAGAKYLHIVDLDGARTGKTQNFDTVKQIVENTDLKVEIGGGVRNIETVDKYISSGAFRVIIGSAAVKDPAFLQNALDKYGEKIAVGVDVKDGKVAVNGWLEKTDCECESFCEKMQSLGVKTIICTDISKDGMLSGTNLDLYRSLSSALAVDIVASGGISSLDDVKTLRKMNLYGAILGKSLYTGALSLRDAIDAAESNII